MPKKKFILIDIDGVACSHAKAICKYINMDYNLNAKYKDITSWNHNFGPVTFLQAVDKYYPNRDFILKMEMTPGFKVFFKHIKNSMLVIFASTRRYSKSATREWIKNHFGDTYKVIFLEKKIDTHFDYIIDDYPNEVIYAARKKKIGFLMKRPWNNNAKVRNELKRFKNIYIINNFKDILNILKLN